MHNLDENKRDQQKQRAEIQDLIWRAVNLARYGIEVYDVFTETPYDADEGDQPPDKIVQMGLDKLKSTWETYGPQKVLDAFHIVHKEYDSCSHLICGWGDEGPEILGQKRYEEEEEWRDVYHLAWCARAGLPGSTDLLKRHLESGNISVFYEAAFGLAYLGLDQGFDIIEQMCNNEEKQRYYSEDEISRELIKMDAPRAKEILAKLNRGEYSR